MSLLALQQLNTNDHTFLSSVEGGERGQGSGWVAAHRGVREEPEAEVRGSRACVPGPSSPHSRLQEGEAQPTAILTQLVGEESGD